MKHIDFDKFLDFLWGLLIIAVVASLLLPSVCKGADPLSDPLDSVGVSGYDSTLCNDTWNYCTDYDRQQFDTRYPGISLDSISKYPLRGSEDPRLDDQTEAKNSYLEDRARWYGERARQDRRSQVRMEEDETD